MKRAITAALVSLAALVTTIAILFVVQRDSSRWVLHSRTVAREAREVLKLAVDRETGVRGFLLAGDSSFLAPEVAASARLPALLADLERQTADNPDQQALAREVTRALGNWDRVDRPRLLRSAGADGAARVHALREAKASFDVVRRHLGAFIEREDELYRARQQRDQRINLWGLLIVIAEVAIITAVVVWSDKRLMGQASQIAVNNAQLQEQAVELEVTLDEAQQAARELEDTLALLNAALGSAPTAFALVDDAGRVSYANPVFAALAQGEAAASPGEGAPLPEWLSEALGTAMEEVRRTRRPSEELRIHGVGYRTEGLGSRSNWSITCYPVVSGDRLLGVGVVGADTTEQDRLEAEIRQSNKMDAIGQLAGGIAHDFNNILTVITSYAQMLLLDLSDSPQRSDVEQIVKAAGRASTMTKQLLSFARKESLQREPVNLNEVITGLRDMLSRLIGERIEVLTRFAPSLPAVLGDAGQFEQMLINLAVNARDAMPAGGTLLLETAVTDIAARDLALHPGLSEGSYVVVGVSDTGVGMDADTQTRIFEPFFSTKGRGQGTGIGLSTVYGIVREAGGHVGVYSEPGEGTTFRVWLPVATDAPVWRTPPRGFAKVSHEPETKVVLLADDDESVREVVERVLQRAGYTVIVARDGAEALDICAERARRRERLDLLITDVIMPEISGPALAEEARMILKSLRVLYMSGYTGTHLSGADLPEGVTNFVEKPFTVESLLSKVAEVFESAPETPRVSAGFLGIDDAEQRGGRAAREMARRAVEAERRRAAAGQRVIEAQHRAVMDALQEGVVVVDAAGIIRMSNPSASRVLAAGAALPGSHLREIPTTLLDEDCEVIPLARHPALRALREGDTGATVFGTRRDESGGIRWWIGRAVSLKQPESSDPRGVVWSFSEVTERKLAEDALSRARTFAATVLENVTDAVIACDEDGAISIFNHAARELTGHAESEVQMRDVTRHFQILHPDGRPFTVDELPLARALRGELVQHVEMRVRRPDGVVRDALSSGRPMHDHASGRILGAVVALHDITRQKAFERELRAALEEARAANRVKHDFLMQMSHELRTPLNVIIGFSGTMTRNRAGRLTAQDLSYLQRIQAAGLRLLRTVEDVLLIVEGRAELSSVEPVDLGELLTGIAREAEAQHGQAIELCLDVPGGLEPVCTRQSSLRTAIMRLMENAFKFTSAGRVTVRVLADDRRRPTAIAITDTGPGMTQATMDSITEPFSQGDAGMTRRHDGAGLGLNVVLVHCRAIGATLDIESAIGEGSTFTLRLPAPEGERVRGDCSPAAAADA